jgi:phosphate transport system permease protein
MNARSRDRLATGLLWLAGVGILAILAFFLYSILSKGLGTALDPAFWTTKPSATREGGGVAQPLFNTFYLTGLSLLFSLPVGVGAGIYMAEYAKPGRFTDFIRLCTEALASVPSIVLGLFGMIVFVNTFRWGFTILGGALTLALLNLPTLVRVTEDSVRAVPQSYREGSLALGATQWQTVVKTVVPPALTGILTGVILVAGRAIGETAILIYTAGVTTSRFIGETNLFASGGTLAVHLWYIKSEGLVPDAARIANGSAALLILVVLAFNLLLTVPLYFWQKRRGGAAH